MLDIITKEALTTVLVSCFKALKYLMVDFFCFSGTQKPQEKLKLK